MSGGRRTGSEEVLETARGYRGVSDREWENIMSEVTKVSENYGGWTKVKSECSE